MQEATTNAKREMQEFKEHKESRTHDITQRTQKFSSNRSQRNKDIWFTWQFKLAVLKKFNEL